MPQYSLDMKGSGQLHWTFGVVAFQDERCVILDGTDGTNELRRREAREWLSHSPRTGKFYYDEDARKAAKRILEDLADPCPGLITVTFTPDEEGERVTITCMDGAKEELYFPAGDIRDRRHECAQKVKASVDAIFEAFEARTHRLMGPSHP